MIRRLSLQSATGGDLDAVGRLLRELNLQFEDETPEAQVLSSRIAELLGDHDIEIVLAEDPPIGLAIVRLRKSIWTPHREANLVELYVMPARRSSGVERQLVEAAMDAARDRGADYMELFVGSANVERRALYEGLGFDNHDFGSDDAIALHYARPL